MHMHIERKANRGKCSSTEVSSRSLSSWEKSFLSTIQRYGSDLTKLPFECTNSRDEVATPKQSPFVYTVLCYEREWFRTCVSSCLFTL